LKKATFAELSGGDRGPGMRCSPSNTRRSTIDELARFSTAPPRMPTSSGHHFIQPRPNVMKLTEVVRARDEPGTWIETVVEDRQRIGKVGRSRPATGVGFVANRKCSRNT